MAEDLGFRPEHKLSRAEEFSAVFASRRVLRGVLFVLHYRHNEFDTARLGLIIPKRNAKRAVLRNRFKRLAREVFRHRRAGLPKADLLLRLASPVKSPASDNGAWRAEIESLLSRLPQSS